MNKQKIDYEKIVNWKKEVYKLFNKNPNNQISDQKFELKFPILSKVIGKTVGFNMMPGIKAMSEEESWEWHKKHARIDPKTGNMIVSGDEIGDGSFEKKYKK